MCAKEKNSYEITNTNLTYQITNSFWNYSKILPTTEREKWRKRMMLEMHVFPYVWLAALKTALRKSVLVGNVLNFKFATLEGFYGTPPLFNTLLEVFKQLKKLDLLKSSGPSNMTAWALQDLAYFIAPQPISFFNNVIRDKEKSLKTHESTCNAHLHRHWSWSWKKLKIVSITSALSKVIKNCYLLNLLNTHTHLMENRSKYGFRSKHSTIDELLHSLECFIYSMD